MAAILPNMNIVALFAIPVFGMLVFLYHRALSSESKCSIPGPSLWEYFPGGLMYPLISDLTQTTKTLYAAAKRYGGTFQVWMGPSRVIITADPRDVVQVLTNGYDFPRADFVRTVHSMLGPRGLVTMLSSEHTYARKVLTDGFSYADIPTFEKKMNEVVAGLCASLQATVDAARPEKSSDVVDISKQFALTTFQAICNIAFDGGIHRNDVHQITLSLDSFLDELMTEYICFRWRNISEIFGTRKRLHMHQARLVETCRGFIEKRRTESADQKAARPRDLFDSIIDLSNGDETLVLSMMKEFALAGHSSTSQALAWAIYEICCKPEVEKEIVRELRENLGHQTLDQPISSEDVSRLTYMNKVWKETLRKHASALTTTKQAQKAMTLKGSGYHIPKGALVITFTAWSQMDPRVWKNPLEFRPERFGHGSDRSEADRVRSGTFIPFSIGPLACPGKFFVNYEGPLILAELFRRFTFDLATKESDVVSISTFVEMARSPSKTGGKLDSGVQVRIRQRDY